MESLLLHVCSTFHIPHHHCNLINAKKQHVTIVWPKWDGVWKLQCSKQKWRKSCHCGTWGRAADGCWHPHGILLEPSLTPSVLFLSLRFTLLVYTSFTLTHSNRKTKATWSCASTGWQWLINTPMTTDSSALWETSTMNISVSRWQRYKRMLHTCCMYRYTCEVFVYTYTVCIYSQFSVCLVLTLVWGPSSDENIFWIDWKVDHNRNMLRHTTAKTRKQNLSIEITL